jgi:hypothetical protein
MLLKNCTVTFLGFDNFDYFSALIFAAMGTSTVSADLLMAVRALGHLRDLQRVMSPARRCPAF